MRRGRARAEMSYQHTEPQLMDSAAVEEAFGVTTTPLAETVDAA